MTGKELSIKNLRILTFGDTHGRGVWEDVIEKEGIENFDLIIFANVTHTITLLFEPCS